MMVSMPINMKHRLQNIPQYFREKKDEKLAEKEQGADIKRVRMTEADSLGSSFEWSGKNTRTSSMVRVEAVRVHRKRQPIITAEGINKKAGYGIVAVLAFVLIVVLLVDLGGIGYTNRQIKRTENRIETFRRDSEKTETQLADQKGDSKLISQAVGLNMVSAGSNVIVLHAPENANLTFDMNEAAQVSSENLAVIQGD